jgi:hypothetical protein
VLYLVLLLELSNFERVVRVVRVRVRLRLSFKDSRSFCKKLLRAQKKSFAAAFKKLKRLLIQRRFLKASCLLKIKIKIKIKDFAK